jgi:hypothetical protein
MIKRNEEQGGEDCREGVLHVKEGAPAWQKVMG